MNTLRRLPKHVLNAVTRRLTQRRYKCVFVITVELSYKLNFESLDAQRRRGIHYSVYRVYIKVYHCLAHDVHSFSVSTASTVGE